MSLAAERASEWLWVKRKQLPGVQAKVSQLTNVLMCLLGQG